MAYANGKDMSHSGLELASFRSGLNRRCHAKLAAAKSPARRTRRRDFNSPEGETSLPVASAAGIRNHHTESPAGDTSRSLGLTHDVRGFGQAASARFKTSHYPRSRKVDRSELCGHVAERACFLCRLDDRAAMESLQRRRNRRWQEGFRTESVRIRCGNEKTPTATNR